MINMPQLSWNWVQQRSHRLLRLVFVGVSAVVVGCNSGAIAVATEQPIGYVIDATSDQSFDSLVGRAEVMAVSFINRAFATNSTTTSVSLAISADRFGNISPLFFVKVTRAQWQSQPSIQAWAKYPSNTPILLGYQKLTPSKGSSPLQQGFPTASNPNSEPNFYN